LDTFSPPHGQAEGIEASSTKDGDVKDAAEESNAAQGPTRAEKLASEIFHFVSVASSLASALQSTVTPKGSSGMYKDGVGYQPSQKETSIGKTEQEVDSNEVQLLRMRSKKHEIIIYPDPKFLCCVVQNMERHSN
jgi:hypothetical protein